MKIDGGCLCGLITYEATINPERTVICHCTDCQVTSGSAFRWIAPVRAEHFRLTAGQPKIYVKTAASGAKRAQAFCSECGTHLYGSDVVDTQSYTLRLATARQAKQLRPSLQIWRRSALGWLKDIDTFTSFDGQPPARG